MRKLLEESHTKKGKKKKEKFAERQQRPEKKKKAGDVKTGLTDSVTANMTSVVCSEGHSFQDPSRLEYNESKRTTMDPLSCLQNQIRDIFCTRPTIVSLC